MTMTVLVFVTVLLMIEGLYLLWRSYKGPRGAQDREAAAGVFRGGDRTPQAHLVKERMLSDVPWMQRMLLTLPRAHRLDRVILQAGLEWTVSSFLLACARARRARVRRHGWLLRPADGADAAAAAGPRRCRCSTCSASAAAGWRAWKGSCRTRWTW
jgi:hypothetical protein